jgi:hypothetical protein
MIGVVMMFVTPASLGFINLVSALVYVFVLPAAGIIIALLFFDLRIRRESVQTSPASAPVEPGQRPRPGGPGEARASTSEHSPRSAPGSASAP